MTREEAQALLNDCVRDELRDRTFSDAEVYWIKDGVEIAVGYFGPSAQTVCFNLVDGSFKDNEAIELRECGTRGRIDYN